MLKTLKFRVLFAFVVLVYLLVTINVLYEQPIDKQNIDVVDLHLKHLSWNRPSRGSLNYDLYVLENNNHYKIGPDWADCFYYSDFTDKVKQGDKIKLGIRKNNGFSSDELKLVVYVTAINENFLDPSCVNDEIANNKIYFPIVGLIGSIILYLLMYYEESKKRKKVKKTID